MEESAHYSKFQASRDALAVRQGARETSTIFRVILPETGLSLRSRPVEVDALVWWRTEGSIPDPSRATEPHRRIASGPASRSRAPTRFMDEVPINGTGVSTRTRFRSSQGGNHARATSGEALDRGRTGRFRAGRRSDLRVLLEAARGRDDPGRQCGLTGPGQQLGGAEPRVA